MRPDSPKEYIGVDVGGAKVGLARGSSAARIAEPLKTINAAIAITELKTISQSSLAAGIVIGLPRSLDGNDTPQTEYVRQWADQAKKNISLPFYWQDEALTSRMAAAKVQGSKSQAQNADEHSLAAALILQDFLDTPEYERLRC